ncbi:hypothetical protein AVEN_267096-1 [Araneus ventricosus]|uniref:Uncharacterized protein n=1 Tax=Araneus ventricosus TaxID=182803 RepID=A0A4Y2MXN9_ARAVE|nr:hypothetical protein AVEN_267096-1 [Araneus ventricosus]
MDSCAVWPCTLATLPVWNSVCWQPFLSGILSVGNPSSGSVWRQPASRLNSSVGNPSTGILSGSSHFLPGILSVATPSCLEFCLVAALLSGILSTSLPVWNYQLIGNPSVTVANPSCLESCLTATFLSGILESV